MGGNQSSYVVPGGTCRVQRWPKTHEEPITSVFAVSPSVCLSSSKDNTFSQFDFKNGKLQKRWHGHSAEVTEAVYGHQSQMYFSASRDRVIHVWNKDSVSPVKSLAGHELVVTALSLNQDNSMLVSGSRDNALILWDVQQGVSVLKNSISRNLITHIHWAPHSNMIAQTGEDKDVRIWDARTLKVSQTFPRKQHIQLCCQISDDRNYCLTSSNGFSGNGCEATLWDLRQSGIVREFKGHMESVGGCCFIPSTLSNGQNLLATCSSDCSVRVWDEQTAECVAVETVPGSGPLTSMAVFPDSCLCVGSFNVGVSTFQLEKQLERWILFQVASF
ncbi:hypothetical protein CAPTEDRAFT_168654 [Capitella teleta]|uniref:Uncharacterized protein n=1 Tax=Capitella teleta TaxID=283909 RepID=R7UKK1_CAPTE|nr:hypothetical protein CAPTEDRAFT_168654 [Capitella teleta]|eukprot:ELU06603.1 hypothetical protein CAPTEDRAFT_168654 [Capitella teleta]